MARTMDPHSATAQFFINVKDNDFLNHSGKTMQGWGYAVFGKVVEGEEVLEKIRNVPTTSRGGHQDVPVEAVIIESVLVDDGERTRQGRWPRWLHPTILLHPTCTSTRSGRGDRGLRALSRASAGMRKPCTSSATCSSSGSAMTTTAPLVDRVAHALLRTSAMRDRCT
jgi:hypothetical protein